MDRNYGAGKRFCKSDWSLSARRAWIEILAAAQQAVLLVSLSARRAWIEIKKERLFSCKWCVALRKESVDRNKDFEDYEQRLMVALRKESVDRNIASVIPKVGAMRSLSARRAWIEISAQAYRTGNGSVALRKESVDRNTKGVCLTVRTIGRSPQGERG